MRSKIAGRTLFRDPWNPTPEELAAWAYTKRAFAPEQDFELALIHTTAFYDMLLAYAADVACPKQRFFLGCLYVLVGDGVRSSWDTFSRLAIERLIQVGIQSDHPDVQLWATRAQDLINNPSHYTYADWGLGSRLVYTKPLKKRNIAKQKRTKS
jgi:hypothetical protein